VADHLIDLGHRNVFFAGGPSDSTDTVERLEGLRAGLASRGAKLLARHVESCESWATEAGMAFGERFLARRPEVTAVVLGNDALALGFMRSVLQAGLRVPQDLSIVGFDGVPEGTWSWPALTTAAQPTWEMGRAACRWLMDAIRSRETHPPPVLVQYPMTLVVRESTGPAPHSRRRRR
jgi:DNA-binding LacI/PurR family transcriptional regulator